MRWKAWNGSGIPVMRSSWRWLGCPAVPSCPALEPGFRGWRSSWAFVADLVPGPLNHRLATCSFYREKASAPVPSARRHARPDVSRRSWVRGVGRLPRGWPHTHPTVCPTTSQTLRHFCPTARFGTVSDVMLSWADGACKGVYPAGHPGGQMPDVGGEATPHLALRPVTGGNVPPLFFRPLMEPLNT